MSGAAGSAGADAAPAGSAGEAGAAALAPALVDDAFSMRQGATLSIPAPGVLDNDTGSSLSVDLVDDSDPTRPAAYDAQALSIDADGRLSFKPKPAFFGIYTVRYTVRDKDGLSATASVKIQVRPVAAELATVRDGIGGFVIDGAAKDAIGAAVSSAGDVNHDGFDDILIGAAKAGDKAAGRAYVVYGKAKPSHVLLKVLPAKSTERAFFELDGAEGDGAGNSVAAIGDLNDDKYADFAVAASSSGPAGATTGAVYVLFGGALSGAMPLAMLPAARGIKLTGTSTVPIGELISRAGDVNGDGSPDLLVSAPLGNGHVYALLGSSTLKSGDLASVPNLLQIEGGSINEHLPLSLDVVGKVNADDADEVVLASLSSVVVLLGTDSAYPSTTATGFSSNGSVGGWRYVPALPGQNTVVAGAGDVNGDPKHQADVLVCVTTSPAPNGVFECHVVLDGAPLDTGWSIAGFSELPRVAHGVDLSGDGYSDLLFGDAGTVYGVFGKKSGFTDVDVSALGDAGFTLSSEAGQHVDSVVSLGDVNGDGVPDYAVGATGESNGAGSVYVVYGGKY